MTEYVLKIDSYKKNYQKITEALQLIPTSISPFWEFSIGEDNKLYPKAIIYFMDLIETNMHKLKKIGIEQENITVWFYKPYEGECNMEFTPQEIKKLASNNVALCISCWEI